MALTQMTLTLFSDAELQIGANPHALERDALFRRYEDKLVVNHALNRAVVSFQANKDAAFYRWFRYKEAFSSLFVQQMLDLFRPEGAESPTVLDPFAGAGTTLTTATKHGWRAVGIELLPPPAAIIQARLISDRVSIAAFESELERFASHPLDRASADAPRFSHIAITRGAFAPETEDALAAYAAFVQTVEDEAVRYLFWFAGLASLEDISYTRKDGQYLRWDLRAARARGGRFHKPVIYELQPTLLSRLRMMRDDIRQRNGGSFSRGARVINGSCLTELPKLDAESFDLVVTSPPYCNRYDYTRTYALELAYMGCTDEDVKALRQTLLSSTVENKSKKEQLREAYWQVGREDAYAAARAAFEQQRALQETLGLLYAAQQAGELNNNNIPIMVENYFFEMNLVVRELARTLKPGGHVVMVNDNVRYHGEEVPVDLILSDLARCAGLDVDVIWVLPQGKGNSSQQMGKFGRAELRKCVYVWSKPA